jgi:hypothetical protein
MCGEITEDQYKFGVYIHKKKGNFAVAYKPEDKGDWDIDTGMMKKHPIFRGISVHVVHNGTGDYFFNKVLKNYEYIGEL